MCCRKHNIPLYKNYTSLIFSSMWPSFATILFVNWWLHILKVRNVLEFTCIHHFCKYFIKRNKMKSHPPTSFSEKVPEKHIINFLDLGLNIILFDSTMFTE